MVREGHEVKEVALQWLEQSYQNDGKLTLPIILKVAIPTWRRSGLWGEKELAVHLFSSLAAAHIGVPARQLQLRGQSWGSCEMKPICDGRLHQP